VSSFVAASLGGMTLAQLGAELIRIDPIGGAPDSSPSTTTGSSTARCWPGCVALVLPHRLTHRDGGTGPHLAAVAGVSSPAVRSVHPPRSGSRATARGGVLAGTARTTASVRARAHDAAAQFPRGGGGWVFEYPEICEAQLHTADGRLIGHSRQLRRILPTARGILPNRHQHTGVDHA
jgi:hypothetical protein